MPAYKQTHPWLRNSTAYDPQREAQVAYQAYGDHAGWRNYTGGPMPAWHELPSETRAHWVAAAEALIGTEDLN